MLVIVAFADGRTISHQNAAGSGEWRRSHGDVLQFTQEVAGMRRLVVAHRLPYHGLAVLMVVPESVVTPFGNHISSVHAYIFIISRTNYDFLAPVAEDVAGSRGRILRPVAVGRAVGCKDDAAVAFEHTCSSLTAVSAVEAFLQEVAVPVDAEVVGKSAGTAGNDLVGYARYRARLRAVADGTGIIV